MQQYSKNCYRKHTNFCGHNILWVKFLRGLIFVGKSSPPKLLWLILRGQKFSWGSFLWGCLATKISPQRKFLHLWFLRSLQSKTTWSLWPKFHASMILYKKVSVESDYLPNLISDCQDLHTQNHSPGVHMYLVVGFCKLCGTLNYKDVKYHCIQLQLGFNC